MNQEIFKIMLAEAKTSEERKAIYEKYISTKIREKIFEELLDPIQFKGDEVWVNNKLLGHLENDVNDMERGIVFKDLKNEEHEFNDIKQFYRYVMSHLQNV